ncbi:MAG: nucleotide pyrophosphohydrolase [Chloroflexi bacterium]|nr:nucleotide pyrophosphohydrolase [Chloroflexota bacterium]
MANEVTEAKRTAAKDDATTVDELRQMVRTFVAQREWKSYHDPKSLAMSIAIEAAELMEHFQWLTTEQSRELLEDEERRWQVEDELADVFIYVLSFANAVGTELSEIVRRKIARNQHRFPVEKVIGKLGDADDKTSSKNQES